MSKAGITADEWSRFIAYAAGFYTNMSNYYSYGNAKFVPEFELEKFKAILFSNPLYDNDLEPLYKEYLDRLWPLVEREIFTMEKPFASIGFPNEGGVSAYFSPQMTPSDLELIKEVFFDLKISPLNTRAFKIPLDNGQYILEISIGSID